MRKHRAMGSGCRFCLSGLLLMFLTLVVGQAEAQTKPPPAGMTQQQYDELVKSVGQSVLQTLEEKGLVAKVVAAPSVFKPSGAEGEKPLAEQVVAIVGRIPKVLAGYNSASVSTRQVWAAAGCGPISPCSWSWALRRSLSRLALVA